MKKQAVSSVSELSHALETPGITEIEITQDLIGVSSILMNPGQMLCGSPNKDISITFALSSDGLRLSADNAVRHLTLITSADRRALWNDYTISDLGILTLTDLTLIGQAQILAKDGVRAGHVEVHDLRIIAADTRELIDRPYGYGVSVLQGAFTLWNMQSDPNVVLTANLIGVSAGRPGSPVLGGGVFVSGAGDEGGRIKIQRLQTGSVYSNGMIPVGTPDQISGGVFTVYGVEVDVVQNAGPVTTYGPNDMAVDNWGSVERWIVEEKITTFGPSGIGFVNFGRLGALQVKAPIETFGLGARGFNVYTGVVAFGEFDRIVTHGDGAVGVQISQPIGEFIFHRGIETFGATGPSLVKGVIQNLSAIALSIKPGGSARKIDIRGGLKTHGKDTAPLEQQGSIDLLQVEGGFFMANDQK
ncbi:MAG: hypothetical protein HIU87_12825 [Acidobacteria bacterium]|nr:hypothetical protein [Acidobacteriota bacterium]